MIIEFQYIENSIFKIKLSVCKQNWRQKMCNDYCYARTEIDYVRFGVVRIRFISYL